LVKVKVYRRKNNMYTIRIPEIGTLRQNPANKRTHYLVGRIIEYLREKYKVPVLESGDYEIDEKELEAFIRAYIILKSSAPSEPLEELIRNVENVFIRIKSL